ncbi:MOSC domain-containing protein [Sulfurimonas marina]|uniref:MOSC domain-containing protein n=1 Tax=Sulfurimonas marina TaxID=2590551 RepID=A0A7M1AXT4_9BACT|nr:MOSC domain-containing protein [Sulfurimonas marina]QOP42244.1 MOSC domain-containing protein [Sulfurimonas marina]
MSGKVLKLFVTSDDEQKTRLTPETITVDNDGVVEDKFYKKDLMRAILITSIDSYNLAKENGVEIEYGLLGENILIDTNPYALVPGQTLKIGDTILEITQNCTLCKGLSTVSSKLPKILKNDRGIFAKVISGKSSIKIGDTVEI